MMPTSDDLSQWIRENMTVNEHSILNENKEAVAALVGVTIDGKVVLKVDKSELNSRQLVLAYLLGKLFSKMAGYSQHISATNNEIASELGMPIGTVGRCLLELRKQGFVRHGQDGGNELVLSCIPAILNAFKESKRDA
jgi:hypothetical protein